MKRPNKTIAVSRWSSDDPFRFEESIQVWSKQQSSVNITFNNSTISPRTTIQPAGIKTKQIPQSKSVVERAALEEMLADLKRYGFAEDEARRLVSAAFADVLVRASVKASGDSKEHFYRDFIVDSLDHELNSNTVVLELELCEGIANPGVLLGREHIIKFHVIDRSPVQFSTDIYGQYVNFKSREAPKIRLVMDCQNFGRFNIMAGCFVRIDLWSLGLREQFK